MKSLSLHKPHAIIMVGIPGSGKTFFAKKFADTFNAPYVSIDDILPLSYDTDAAVVLLHSQLNELLKTNMSVVLEAETSSRQQRVELAKGFRDAGYIPMFVWVQTDPDTAYQRLARSKDKRGVDFEKLLKRFSAPHETEKPVVISGKHTYASQAKIVLKHLSAPRTEISTQSTPPVRLSGQSIVVR